MILVRAAIVVVAVAGAAAPARAQTQPGRVEVALGVQWTSRAAMTSIDANETAADLSKLRLFSSTTELGAAAGIEARVGVRLSRRLEVEATGTYARPQLRVTAGNDYELPAGATAIATEQLRLFSVSGAVVSLVPVRRLGERTTPFVTAGAGYARELHENDTFAVGGAQFYAGGGVKRLLLTRDRRMKSLGVRGDARAIARSKALATDDRVHVSLALTASLFVRF